MALCCADRSKKDATKKWNSNCNHVLVWDQDTLKEEELVRPKGKNFQSNAIFTPLIDHFLRT